MAAQLKLYEPDNDKINQLQELIHQCNSLKQTILVDPTTNRPVDRVNDVLFDGITQLVTSIKNSLSGKGSNIQGGTAEEDRLRKYIQNSTILSILTDIIIQIQTQILKRTDNKDIAIDASVITALTNINALLTTLEPDLKCQTLIENIQLLINHINKNTGQKTLQIMGFGGHYQQFQGGAVKNADEVNADINDHTNVLKFVKILNTIIYETRKLQAQPGPAHILIEDQLTQKELDDFVNKFPAQGQAFNVTRTNNKNDQYQKSVYVNNKFKETDISKPTANQYINTKGGYVEVTGVGNSQNANNQSYMQTMASLDNLQETTMADLENILQKALTNN